MQTYLNQFSLKNVDGTSLTLSGSNYSYTWGDDSSGQCPHSVSEPDPLQDDV